MTYKLSGIILAIIFALAAIAPNDCMTDTECEVEAQRQCWILCN